MEKQVDVVVVGAGPVGLLTAIELTLGGVRVLVLERLAAPSMVMKAGGIGPLGIEALQRRGMAAAIAAAEARSFAAMKKFTEQTGPDLRGRGRQVQRPFRGPDSDPSGRAERAGTAVRPVDQQAARSHAGRPRALALGIEVRRECDVTGFVQQADGVDVEWASPAGAGHIRCS